MLTVPLLGTRYYQPIPDAIKPFPVNPDLQDPDFEKSCNGVEGNCANAWGVRIMSLLPTWWYNTSAFWIEYPHWQMIPELKVYYLLQAAYWAQQLLVLALRLEKPRVDYNELVAHHLVTVWLIG